MILEKYKRIFLDTLSAGVSWCLFFIVRKELIENMHFELSLTLIYGIIGVTTLWLSIYALSGVYTEVRRVSRLNELSRTLTQSTIGYFIIFFTLIIDDIENYPNYTLYYSSIALLIGIHFPITFLFRYIITNSMVQKIQQGEIYFNTILIGDTKTIEHIFRSLTKTQRLTGNHIIGYINSDNTIIKNINIPKLGELEEIETILVNYKIEEAILGEKNQQQNFPIINTLLYHNIITKVAPNNLTELLAGKVKKQSFFDIPCLTIKQIKMSLFESIIKRIIDISISTFALIALIPLFIVIIIGIKLSSKGPIFYLQERLGFRRKIFKIVKFRSMYTDAEKNQPLLATKNDTRITSWGKIMRKYRLDELPQFYNVLIGEMSLIGPRPERDFFAKKIIKKAPHYNLIYKVKPGITSWGMVSFGYAENVEEMIQRLAYDLIYLKNISLWFDFRVFILTIFIILQGRGK